MLCVHEAKSSCGRGGWGASTGPWEGKDAPPTTGSQGQYLVANIRESGGTARTPVLPVTAVKVSVIQGEVISNNQNGPCEVCPGGGVFTAKTRGGVFSGGRVSGVRGRVRSVWTVGFFGVGGGVSRVGSV